MSKTKLMIFSGIVLILTMLLYPLSVSADTSIGHIEESVVSVYDQNNNYIFSTAMGIVKGDRYISQDNIEYVVEKVNKDRAVARKIGEIDLLDGIAQPVNMTQPLAQGKKKLIAIYHTHNAESYNPGPESVTGKGEIHEIGRGLANALEKKGVKVIQSDNLHLPQDGAAYERSRSTALNLAKKRPDAIFDLHRDAIPRKEEYLEKVKGKTISQVRIVVGRQNPNRKSNDQFARSLKAVSDKYYPGLIRDIFYGGGGYNQQVSTHALLLEFGTHVTGKENALFSTKLMGDVVYQFLYGKDKGMSNKTAKKENASSFRTFLWIFAITVIGLFSYLYISEGSISQVKNRLKKYFKREIIDNSGDKGDK